MPTDNILWRLRWAGDEVVEGYSQVSRASRRAGDASERHANRSSVAFQKLTSVVRAYGAQLATLASFAGFSLLVNQTVSLTREQGLLAESLSTTTRSLQLLSGVASRVGVNYEQVRSGFSDYTRRLSQAADGLGPAVAALDRLGLSADSLQRQSLDDQLLTIADAMSRVTREGQRLAVAGQLFGEEGSINLLRIAGGIRQNRQFLRDSGIVLNESDNRRIQELGLAFEGIGQQLRGLGNIIVKEITPVLTDLAKAFSRLLTALVDPVTALARGFNSLVTNIVEYSTALGLLGVGVGAGRLFTGLGQRIADEAAEQVRTRALFDPRIPRSQANPILGEIANARRARRRSSILMDAGGVALGRVFRDFGSRLATVGANLLRLTVLLGGLPAFLAAATVVVNQTRQFADENPVVFDPLRGYVRIDEGGRGRGAATAEQLQDTVLEEANREVRLAAQRTDRTRQIVENLSYENVLRSVGLYDSFIEEHASNIRADALSLEREAVRLQASRRFNPNRRPTSFDAFGNPVFDGIGGVDGTFAPSGSPQLVDVTDQARRRGEIFRREQERQEEERRRLAEQAQREEEERQNRSRERLMGLNEINRSALAEFFNQAETYEQRLEAVFVNVFSGLSGAFRQFLETGRFDFKGFLNNILLDIAEANFQQTFVQGLLGPFLNIVGGGISNLFGFNPQAGLSGLGGLTGSALDARAAVGGIGSAQSGGMLSSAGVPGNQVRNLPLSIFENAPRLQTGGFLRAGEIPVVGHSNELLLNARQTREYLSGDRNRGDREGLIVNINAPNSTVESVERLEGFVNSPTFRDAVINVNNRLRRGN